MTIVQVPRNVHFVGRRWGALYLLRFTLSAVITLGLRKNTDYFKVAVLSRMGLEGYAVEGVIRRGFRLFGRFLLHVASNLVV